MYINKHFLLLFIRLIIIFVRQIYSQRPNYKYIHISCVCCIALYVQMRDLFYDKRKKKDCAIVAEFLEVTECVLDFRPTLYNPSLHSVASKVYPFTLRSPRSPI